MNHQCAKCGKATPFFNEIYCMNIGRPQAVYLCKKHLEEINGEIFEFIGAKLV